MVNLKKDNRPLGTIGYFWARDNFFKTEYPDSNEALAIIVDAETYYLDEDGKFYILSVIAHELTHTVNFYQRFVLMSNSD